MNSRGTRTSSSTRTMGNRDSTAIMSTDLRNTMMEVDAGNTDEEATVVSMLSSRIPSFQRRGNPAPVVPAEGSFGLPRASSRNRRATTQGSASAVAGTNTGYPGSGATASSAGVDDETGSRAERGSSALEGQAPALPKCDAAAVERRRRSRIAKIMRMSNVSWVEKQRLIQSVRSPRPTGGDDGTLRIRRGHIPTSPADAGASSPSSSENALGTALGFAVAVQTPEPPKLGDLKVRCAHYDRGCDIYAECCRRWVPCRRCHDENSEHKMIRADIKSMRCRHCKTEQPVGATCRNKKCGKKLGEHFCNECRLWTKFPIHHCDKCGGCRRAPTECGTLKEMFHCDRCKVCVFKPHTTCYSGEAQCPFCCENLLDSTEVWGVMPGCGHTAHRSCIMEYLKHKNNSIPNCPICRKTILTEEAQASLWQQYKAQISSCVMPPEYAKDILIKCNDCEKQSRGKLHWIANECDKCGSFNTWTEPLPGIGRGGGGGGRR